MSVEFEHVQHIESDRANLQFKSKSFMVRALLRWEVAKSEAQANIVLVLFSVVLLTASFALTFITRVAGNNNGVLRSSTEDVSALNLDQ